MFIFILHVNKPVQVKSNAGYAPTASSDSLRKLIYATFFKGVETPSACIHEIN